MAKSSSTIYLEEKFWKMIVEYQKINELSSRNDALSLILQEWDILRKIDFNNISINISGGIDPIVMPDEKAEGEVESGKKEETNINPKIRNEIFNMANSMKKE